MAPSLPALRSKRRLSLWWPPLLWMCVIFVLSTDLFSANHTGSVLEPILRWAFPAITGREVLLVHLLIRKGAHLTVYGILAALLMRAFRTGSRVQRRLGWVLATLAIVAACGLLDEYHQSFTRERTPSARDSLIDVAGGALSLSLTALARRTSAGRRPR